MGSGDKRGARGKMSEADIVEGMSEAFTGGDEPCEAGISEAGTALRVGRGGTLSMRVGGGGGLPGPMPNKLQAFLSLLELRISNTPEGTGRNRGPSKRSFQKAPFGRRWARRNGP